MTKVEVSDLFREALDEAEEFLLVQDPLSAARRADELENEIVRLLDLLERYPKIGHRANFYDVTTPTAQAWLQRVQQEVTDAGLDEYREFNISPYVVLYAGSDRHVLVVSIRHERQLGYGAIS
jgi:plasmid stabilization system protein ParE